MNYLNTKYPKTRIQNDIMTSTVETFISILGRDAELVKQYEKLVVDLQAIEKTTTTR
jgi:hypothetical protein